MVEVALLGGYGMAGRALARMLAARGDCRIRIGGRSLEKAAALCRTLPPGTAEPRRVDCTDQDSLDQFLNGADWLVMACAATWTDAAAEAALRNRCHWFDLQLSLPAKHQALRDREQRFKQAGLACVTDGGFHPGLPGTMVRRALARSPGLLMANVCSLLRMDWGSAEVSDTTATEFCQELSAEGMRAKVGGDWRKLSYREMPAFDFGAPFGKMTLFPMHLQEMEELPQAQALQECGFYVSGFGGRVDWIDLPIAMLTLRLFGARAERRVGQRLLRQIQRASRPPYQVRLVLVTEDGPQLTVSHQDGYHLTAAAAAVALERVLAAPTPGLQFQAQVLDPEATWPALRALGVSVEAAG